MKSLYWVLKIYFRTAIWHVKNTCESGIELRFVFWFFASFCFVCFLFPPPALILDDPHNTFVALNTQTHSYSVSSQLLFIPFVLLTNSVLTIYCKEVFVTLISVCLPRNKVCTSNTYICQYCTKGVNPTREKLKKWKQIRYKIKWQ